MATITPVLAGVDMYVATVALLAADTTSGNIAHGLGAAPLDVSVSVMATGTVLPTQEGVTIGATNITITKANVPDTERTYRLVARRPHSKGA